MKTAVFLTLALSLPLLAENAVMIDDFEHGINGWSGYKDAASQAPVFSLSDDALRGDNALKVKFNGCQRYQGIQFFKAPRLPQGAKAISFLIKPLSGPPPGDLTLSERNSRYGKDLATATIRLAVTGSDWQKITVPLNTMKPAGRNNGEPFLHSNREVSICCVSTVRSPTSPPFFCWMKSNGRSNNALYSRPSFSLLRDCPPCGSELVFRRHQF